MLATHSCREQSHSAHAVELLAVVIIVIGKGGWEAHLKSGALFLNGEVNRGRKPGHVWNCLMAAAGDRNLLSWQIHKLLQPF